VNKPLPFLYASLLVFVALGVTFIPSSSSADVISVLSSVFRNNSVGALQEIEQVHVKNIQTMPILTATANPLDGSSTIDAVKEVKANASLVEGKALTNENSSVTDGAFSAYSIGAGAASDRISLYTVHDGDTVEQIASMFGVTPNTILWANDLKKGTALSPDQVLVILPISSFKYQVTKGDTVQSVADKFNGDENEIAQFNNMNSGDDLAVGDFIMIPDGDGSILASENKKVADAAAIAADKKKKAAASAKKNPKGTTGSDNSSKVFADSTGYFTRPIIGGVRTQGIHGNNGVDLASTYGTSILAAASGQVIVSKSGGWGGGYGTYVVIKHPNGMQTLYGHLSQALVSVGQNVTKGQEVGKMGSTGQSTGVHLHFEVRGGRNPF
jgi:LysM repeat protein